jgi:RecA/RadA recombinase
VAGHRRRDYGIEPPDIPDPGKPLTEMTLEELAEFRRQLRKATAEFGKRRREKMIRLGKASPRTQAEMEIFASDLLKRSRDAGD